MKYRTLGRTGLRVSVIGFGGIPIQRVPLGDAKAIINRALDLGINFFDTARAYTDSESKLGAALKFRRGEAIIATKSMARTREGMAQDIKQSLATLDIDYIDLYQLHNVKDPVALEQVFGPGGAFVALQEAKREGLIKHIGITGHIRSFLMEALGTGAMETVQFPFNPVETAGVKELLELASKTGAGTIVMKPLAGGAVCNASLALRFALGHDVTTVIPGMDSLAQVEQNTLVGNDPQPLSVEENSALEDESGKLGASFCRRCEYCLPCAQGIDIPTVFLLDGYYTRYELADWARERYRSLKVRVDACVDCGDCAGKCPYQLPIPVMLKEAGDRLS